MNPSPKRRRPVCPAIVFCRRATTHTRLAQFDLLDVFSHLELPAIPVALVIGVYFTVTDAEGDYAFALSVEHDESERTLCRFDRRLAMQSPTAVHDEVASVTFQIDALGTYTVKLFADGEMIGQRSGDDRDYMRHRLPLILALVPLACAAAWARSYWRFDYYGTGRIVGLSDSGSIYFFPSDGTPASIGYVTATAGWNGRPRLEVETGSTWHPWLPCWTWSFGSTRFFVVQWWTITLASAIPAVWTRRCRRERLRGFEVTTVGDQPG